MTGTFEKVGFIQLLFCCYIVYCNNADLKKKT